MSGPRLSARERRTIAIGLGVSIAALVLVWAVLPFGRRWQARESAIAMETQRLARLRGFATGQAALQEAVAMRIDALETGSPRLLQDRTAGLAASSLQSLLQDAAERSGVVVSRLDVAGTPENAGGTSPMIPATVSAIGDVYGITDMLAWIQHGPRLLEIAELTLGPNPALRGELLQVTVKLLAGWTGG